MNNQTAESQRLLSQIDRQTQSDYVLQLQGKQDIPHDKFILGEPVIYAYDLGPKVKGVTIIPISDVHYGNYLFSEHHFLRTVKYIYRHPNTYAILNGDLIECATRNSLGDIYKQKIEPGEQKNGMIEYLKPIKKKILAMTMGNHEQRIYTQVGLDVCADMAEALEVPYRPEGIAVRLQFGAQENGSPYQYVIYATHGYGGARTKGGKAVKVERAAHEVHADVYLMSHDHEVNAAPDVYLMPTESVVAEHGKYTEFKFYAHRKMLVKTNAYLKWGGYSEAKGFSPSDLDTPIIKLAGEGKPKVRVEI